MPQRHSSHASCLPPLITEPAMQHQTTVPQHVMNRSRPPVSEHPSPIPKPQTINISSAVTPIPPSLLSTCPFHSSLLSFPQMPNPHRRTPLPLAFNIPKLAQRKAPRSLAGHRRNYRSVSSPETLPERPCPLLLGERVSGRVGASHVRPLSWGIRIWHLPAYLSTYLPPYLPTSLHIYLI